jgi:hypothetical protein
MRLYPLCFAFAIATGMLSGCGSDTRPTSFGGDGGDTDADTNSDAAPTSTLVGDIERGGNFALELTDGVDTMLFECTAAQGGLITKLALNGVNFLADSTVGSIYGSTFWVAPQSLWVWPPPTVLDTDAFTPTVDLLTSTVTLTSGVDTDLNFQVIKKFSPDLVRFAIVLEYVIVNTGAAPLSLAPWEITRVFPNGVTFFPTGGEVNAVDMTQLNVTDIGGITWFDHTVPLSSGDYKYCADGRGGLLAHAAQNLVLVKSFQDEPASAKPPGQGEIQLYVKGGAYEEVEQMGAYREIPVGEKATWTVRWYLRNLPSTASIDVGNQGLVDFVNSLVQ